MCLQKQDTVITYLSLPYLRLSLKEMFLTGHFSD